MFAVMYTVVGMLALYRYRGKRVPFFFAGAVVLVAAFPVSFLLILAFHNPAMGANFVKYLPAVALLLFLAGFLLKEGRALAPEPPQ